MDEVFMLTTIDNPFNPFTSYDEWYRYDELKGYCTCGLLARFTLSSDELSDEDQTAALYKAMDEIVALNLSGLHIKITSEYVVRA